MDSARYQRQSRLPMIGEAGQAKLAAARVLIVGCGALGSTVADQLARAGVGFLRLVDRDLVEETNLQRQTLYAESDIDTPKSEAAARRLSAINSTIHLHPIITEANAATIRDLVAGIDLIVDGTDNVETRDLLNDISVDENIPWIYGGCVATEGRCMLIRPGVTPCLRCIFPVSPAAENLPTCATAGILGAAAAVVGSLQATIAIQLLSGNGDAVPRGMTTFDLWTGRWRRTLVDLPPNPDCATCGRRHFDSLRQAVHNDPEARVLCGRNAVQFRSSGRGTFDLKTYAARWSDDGEVRSSTQFIRFRPADAASIELSLFQDGRVIVHGCDDVARARTLYDRYLA